MRPSSPPKVDRGSMPPPSTATARLASSTNRPRPLICNSLCAIVIANHLSTFVAAQEATVDIGGERIAALACDGDGSLGELGPNWFEQVAPVSKGEGFEPPE
jgi:hypothetical protein